VSNLGPERNGDADPAQKAEPERFSVDSSVSAAINLVLLYSFRTTVTSLVSGHFVRPGTRGAFQGFIPNS